MNFKLGIVLSLLPFVTSVVLGAPSNVGRATNVRPATRRWESEPPYSPKVLLVSMFAPEAAVWAPLNLTQNITVPGLSPLYPNVSCNEECTICQYTAGEAEVNAAASAAALFFSSLFDFSQTYVLIGGIAGVNPYEGTTGTVAFARFAVSVALQYELDAREIPEGWSTGYWARGTTEPGLFPTTIYGTERYELNTNLLSRVLEITSNVTLEDSPDAAAYRASYNYAPANETPSIIQCDVAASDVWFTGDLLSEAFGNYTNLITNGTGTYCMTAQEDCATLEGLLRADTWGVADYSRAVLIRVGANFDRAPPGVSQYASLEADPYGFDIGLANIYNALNPVVQDIITNWDEIYEAGFPAPDDGFYPSILGLATLNL